MFCSVQSKKGFTLIELLVVIGIIALLTAVILPSFSAARKKGRIAQRVADLKQVQASLEFYYAANRSYPSTSGTWRSVCSAYGGYTANNVIPGLAPTFIPVVPTDPQMDAVNNANCYMYKSDGNDWAFMDYNVTELLSTASSPNYNAYPELIDPARDGGLNNAIVDGVTPTAWKVFSAGGISW